MSEWWKEKEGGELASLPSRVRGRLFNANITTVEQLKTSDPFSLLRIDGIGRLGFQQIKDFLNSLESER